MFADNTTLNPLQNEVGPPGVIVAETTPSSIVTLQLSSMELHISIAPGLIAALPSLQSVLLVTEPITTTQLLTGDASALPNPSASESV